MCELDQKEGWVLKNRYFRTVVLEKTLESPLDCKEIKIVNPKGNQPWIFLGKTDDEAKALTFWPLDLKSCHWKRPRCWERLRAGGEGGNRGWDGWMAPLTQWPWVSAISGRRWKTGKPGVLQSMRSQIGGHDWVTEPQQCFIRDGKVEMEEGISEGSSHKLSLEDRGGLRGEVGHRGGLIPGAKAPGGALDVSASSLAPWLAF